MRILLTNDDGISAPGLAAVHKILRNLGDVTVIAPDSERSSISHAITLAHPLFAKEVKIGDGATGFAVSGNPADCVKLGIAELMKKKPDIVISGINLGANDGCSVFYSGTVAGAREGAICGIPSMAVSLATFFNPDFRYAAKVAARLAKRLAATPPVAGTFLNVNVPAVPAKKIKGVRICRQGKVPIHGVFDKRKDPHARHYYWMSGKQEGIEQDMQADTYALEHNYVSVVPIQCDATDYAFLDAMRSWKL